MSVEYILVMLHYSALKEEPCTMYRYGSVNDVGIEECERMCVTYLN